REEQAQARDAEHHAAVFGDLGALLAPARARGWGRGRRRLALAQGSEAEDATPQVAPDPAIDARKQQALVAIAPDQKEQAGGREKDVRGPHGDPTGDLAEACRLLAVE